MLAQRCGAALDDFYPRPPRGGRRCHLLHVPLVSLFLSTPSARRATHSALDIQAGDLDFYPRPPRGGRRVSSRRSESRPLFLSTPSARRATFDVNIRMLEHITFLSTPSARRATVRGGNAGALYRNFYPRPPRGGRPQPIPRHRSNRRFLSTPSARRATVRGVDGTLIDKPFLSTPSARRATLRLHMEPTDPDNFYPRPPRGGRLPVHLRGSNHKRISIHALREEGDSKNGEKHLRFCFIIKRSAQIWKSLSKNIRKNSCDLHRMA